MKTNYINMQEKSEIELLSLTLKESVDSNAIKSLLAKINALEELLHLTEQELDQIGLEKGSATQFIAGMELANRIYSSPSRLPKYIKDPQEAVNFFMPQMRFKDREIVKCLCLTRKCTVISSETVSIGSLSSSIVHPREVYKTAIRKSAASIILCHNHPSGDPSPSKEDIDITKNIYEAGSVLGIELLDHIIIGDGKWISMKQLKLMK